MKKTTLRMTHFITSLVVGGFVLFSIAAYSQDSSLEEVMQSAQSDLEQSLAELASRREEIAAEKVPLVASLNSTESEIRGLRREAARLQAIRDSRELSLNDLTANIQAWENENLYILNLLDEYASRFRSAIDISELSQYSELLDVYREADGGDFGQSAVEVQLRVVDQGLERVRGALGSSQYLGDIVSQDGSLNAGTFTRFGPLVYFQSRDRETGGIVSGEEGLNPRILPFNNRMDDIGSMTNGELASLPVDVTEGRVAQIVSNEGNLFSHIARGGIWIIPILFFALLSLSISIYKAIQIYSLKLPSAETVKIILSKLRQEKIDEAAELSQQIPAPMGPMLAAGVAHSSESPELVEEVLYENILEARPALNKLLPVVATTAAVAPLLGLLGTVTGMINTFNLISVFGTGDARVLSSGISEALVTTEFGLIVAIPALLIHALLSRQIKSILGDMEKYALMFSNGLAVNGQEDDHE